MKKIYFALFISFLINNFASAQTVLLSENFTLYDSLSGPNYNGWTLSYYGFGSYYTSTQSSGPSGPNSYKFGRDSSSAYTPLFPAGGDSIHFHMKGNTATGGSMAQSTFYVYESMDGTNFSLLHTFSPPISTVSALQHLAIASGTIRIKFYYDKDTGNVAFDDFKVTSSTSGINNPTLEQRVKIFPTPTSGKLNINFGSDVSNISFSIINILGKPVMFGETNVNDDACSINLTNLQDGIYFLKLKADQQSLTKRIIVRH